MADIGNYDTVGIIATFSFLGANHLLHDGAVGLLDHADAQGVQDTQRRRLVQLFLHPSRLAVAQGQASEKASASKSFHCPAREVPLSRFIQPAHQLNKSSCTKCIKKVLGSQHFDSHPPISM